MATGADKLKQRESSVKRIPLPILLRSIRLPCIMSYYHWSIKCPGLAEAECYNSSNDFNLTPECIDRNIDVTIYNSEGYVNHDALLIYIYIWQLQLFISKTNNNP